jgi:CheY-like chemotaxis protein
MLRPQTDTSPTHLQVLVVDDDAASRSLVCDQLEDAGHVCLTATNGREALDVLTRAEPDLVILDLEMPVMDGWELRRRMLGVPAWAAIPSVVLSNHRDSARDGLQVDEVIEKPIEPDRLLALLDAARSEDRDRERAAGHTARIGPALRGRSSPALGDWG